MKRALAALAAVSLLFFCACAPKGYSILSENAGAILSIEVTALSSGKTVVVPAEKLDTCAEFIENLLCGYDGYCSDSDPHEYLLKVRTRTGAEGEIYLNADGTVCKNSLHRTVIKEKDAAYNLSIWEALFDNADEGPSVEQEESGTWNTAYLDMNSGSPMPASSATRWKSSEPLLEIGEWSYLTGIIELNGTKYSVAARERTGREIEIIFGARQNYPQKSAVSYVWGSYQRSGGYLYYCAEDSSGNCAVYSFDTARNAYARVLEGPCSNLLLLSSPKEGYEKIGWAVTADKIAALDLTTGAIDPLLSVSINSLSDLSEIHGSFVRYPSEGYNQKYARLDESKDGYIAITVTECPAGKPDAGKTYQYIFNPKTFSFSPA